MLRLEVYATLQKVNKKFLLVISAKEEGWSIDPDMKAESKKQCAADRSKVETALTYKVPLDDAEANDYLAGKDVSVTIDKPFAAANYLAGTHPTFKLKQKLLVQSGSVPGANDDDVP